MKLTTDLLEVAMGVRWHSVVRGSRRTLDLLLRCSNSHRDYTHLLPDLFKAYAKAKRRKNLLWLVHGLMWAVGITLMSMTWYFDHQKVFVLGKIGIIMFAAASLWRGIIGQQKWSYLSTQDSHALAKFRELSEILLFKMGYNVQDHDPVCSLSPDWSEAKILARQEADSLIELENKREPEDSVLDKERSKVHAVLRALADAGLIEKDWKKVYFGAPMEPEMSSA